MANSTKQQPAIVSEYEKALQRARKSGIHVIGRGRLKQNGWPFVAVSSSKEPNRAYIVTICPARLICDCFAGLRGKLCIHRAIVHELLLREWRKERDRVEAEETAMLREALRRLNRMHIRLDEAIRASMPPREMSTAGDAPTVSQDQAATLLQRGFSGSPRRLAAAPDVLHLDERGVAADVRRETVRGYSDTRAISIWK